MKLPTARRIGGRVRRTLDSLFTPSREAWLLTIGASLALLAILVPAEFWNQPDTAATYEDFDPQLISVSERGIDGRAEGRVELSAEEIVLRADPESHPTVHLLTTPFDRFHTEIEATVVEAGADGLPLRYGVWTPRGESGFFLEFGPAPAYELSAVLVQKGKWNETLLDARQAERRVLGVYVPGQPYAIDLTVDKAAEEPVVDVAVRTAANVPGDGGAIRLRESTAGLAAANAVSDLVPVIAGERYAFGGQVRAIAGTDAYRVVVGWFDENRHWVDQSLDNWRPVADLDGWTAVVDDATAPPRAAFAQLILSSGSDTQIWFADLVLTPLDPQGNVPQAVGPVLRDASLLTNGALRNGSAGWSAAGGSGLADVISGEAQVFSARATQQELPDLLGQLRLSVTAQGVAGATSSHVALQDYRLEIGNQRWFVAHVADPAATGLALLALAFGAAALASAAYRRYRRRRAVDIAPRSPWARLRPSRREWYVLGGAGLLFLIVGGLLVDLGSHPFDIRAHTVAAYTGAMHGPVALYSLPNTVSLADTWGGTPWHEAVFPYGGLFAYIFSGIGLAGRLFLSGPEGLDATGAELTFLVKWANLAFVALNAFLLYSIVGHLGVRRRWAIAVGLLFLLNPAVLFTSAIWGQTQAWSISFVLAAILATVRGNVTGAWLALAGAAMTRPQILIPAGLLVFYLLYRYRLTANLRGAAWGLVAAFVVSAPFVLQIAPSYPLDVIRSHFEIQAAGGNETALTTVSIDAFSFWPLVTNVVDGQSGLARIFFGSEQPLIGSLTYQQVSQILVVTLTALVAGVLWLGGGRQRDRRAFIAWLAFGTLAFLFFQTGLAAAHFFVGVPFLLLCRPFLPTLAWGAAVSTWTITSLIPMWGSWGLAILPFPEFAPDLHPDANALTQIAMDLYTSDIFMTAAIIANIGVLLLVFGGAMRSSGVTVRLPRARGSPRPLRGGGPVAVKG